MIHVKFTSRPARTLCFDLENRPLAYWYDGNPTSEITAFAWKWSDSKHPVKTMLLRKDGDFQIDGGVFKNSPRAVGKKFSVPNDMAYEMFCDELKEADLVYGHNIRKHDLPILQAGLLRRQLPILPPLLTSDTLVDYPKRSGMSRSLENLAAMYDLGGEKYHMSQPAWEKANRLSDDGLELARKRVVSDVLLQEKLRNKLLDLNILKPPRAWNP